MVAGRARGRPNCVSWRLDGSAAVLDGPHVALARYEPGDRMSKEHAPRPYLHQVRTLNGIALTDTAPRDHPHHYGLSLAVADVNGTSHWGGPTFVRDEGSTLLQNHGRQVSGGMHVAEGNDTDRAGLVGDVTWYDENGARQLREDRTIGGVLLVQADAWALRWHSLLHADHGALRFASPATNGRPGAGYGGLFWRLPMAEETIVLTDSGTGEEHAHGSSSRWLAFAQRRADAWTTLVLAQELGAVLPWFVRAAEYPGAGPALAWDQPRTLPAGGTLELTLTAVLVDRQLNQDGAAELADLADLTHQPPLSAWPPRAWRCQVRRDQ
jgi:LacI family transcriptional regulator